MRFKKHQTVYVRSMGKALKVTALFTSDNDANDYLTKHPDEGVVAVFDPYIFIADLYDSGVTIHAKDS